MPWVTGQSGNAGRTIPIAERVKRSESAKEKGIGSWMAGRTMPLETRQKIAEKMSGNKTHLWQGGKTQEAKLIRTSWEYRFWRTAVFKRDNYTCQNCGARNGNGHTVYLEADHIKSFADFPELRFDIANGRTLCRDCHQKTNTWGRRKKGIE